MRNRGSEPTNLINLRSGSRIRMVEVEGLGLVHEGFYSALHFRDPEQGSLADQLIQQLDALSSCPLKSIHLTGAAPLLSPQFPRGGPRVFLLPPHKHYPQGGCTPTVTTISWGWTTRIPPAPT